MKKTLIACIIAVLLLSALTACGRTEMAITENTGKRITLEAGRASKDTCLVTGSLEVEEGEQVTVVSGLKKGEIRIEILAPAGMDDSNTIPDVNGADVIMNVLIGPGNSASGTMAAGTYLLRATCTEKATGTITVEVNAAD